MALPLLAFGGIGVVLGLGSLYLQNKAAQEERAAVRAQQAAVDIRAQKERVESVRQARITRARVVSQGEAVGAGDSSGVSGGTASVASQVASGLSTSYTMQSLSQNVSSAKAKAIGYQEKAAVLGAGASLSTDIFTAKGGWAQVF